MKRILLAAVCVLGAANTYAQTETKAATDAPKQEEGYNKWSLELNGGVNKAQRPFTEGYTTSTPSFYNADFGVRYMFNPKFGLKAQVGYYNIENKDNTLEFKSQFYTASLQGVANLGRIMNFESWTNRLGLLAHLGGGYAQLKSDNHDFTDKMGNFIVGLTGQLRLSDKVVLTGDFTSLTNVRQNRNWDGNERVEANTRGFDGGIFSGTIGLTVYLGKNQKHADWYAEADKTKEEIAALQERVGDLETMLSDSDADGIPDAFDKEPNTPAGVAVNSKGQAIDKNNNGVPDELESYLDKTYGDGGSNTNINNNTPSNNELIKNLINEGYVTTYFDFNKSTPTNVSTEGIDFILTYLRNNPSASVDIIGHADELGKSEFNNNLSNKRANAVKNILLKAKIDSSRLNLVPAGEDNSVDKESAGARKLVRRVTFRVK